MAKDRQQNLPSISYPAQKGRETETVSKQISMYISGHFLCSTVMQRRRCFDVLHLELLLYFTITHAKKTAGHQQQ